MSVAHIKKWRGTVETGGRNRKKRAKSFTSEESANAYAKANGIAKYTLRNLRSTSASDKKIVIVQ